jgi:hypothetical protein
MPRWGRRSALATVSAAGDKLSGIAAEQAEAELKALEEPLQEYLKQIHAAKLALAKRHEQLLTYYSTCLSDLESKQSSLNKQAPVAARQRGQGLPNRSFDAQGARAGRPCRRRLCRHVATRPARSGPVQARKDRQNAQKRPCSTYSCRSSTTSKWKAFGATSFPSWNGSLSVRLRQWRPVVVLVGGGPNARVASAVTPLPTPMAAAGPDSMMFGAVAPGMVMDKHWQHDQVAISRSTPTRTVFCTKRQYPVKAQLCIIYDEKQT